MRWYTLNSSDEISDLNPDWRIEGSQYVGRRIWDFFDGAAAYYYYSKIFEDVRSTGNLSSVMVRCDKPDLLVELQIDVAPLEERQLLVTIETVREVPTDYQAIWDPDIVRSGGNVRVCSWCQSIRVREGVWMPFVEAVKEIGLLRANQPPEITHGICENCKIELDVDD